MSCEKKRGGILITGDMAQGKVFIIKETEKLKTLGKGVTVLSISKWEGLAERSQFLESYTSKFSLKFCSETHC